MPQAPAAEVRSAIRELLTEHRSDAVAAVLRHGGIPQAHVAGGSEYAVAGVVADRRIGHADLHAANAHAVVADRGVVDANRSNLSAADSRRVVAGNGYLGDAYAVVARNPVGGPVAHDLAAVADDAAAFHTLDGGKAGAGDGEAL